MTIVVDKRIFDALSKQLKKIGDEQIARLFERGAQCTYRYDPTLPKLFSEKRKQLKKLFPKNFGAFKDYYENRIMTQISTVAVTFAEMAFIEYAPIDFSKWGFLDAYFSPDSETYYPRGVTPFMIARAQKDLKTLLDKINKYPSATNVLLPAVLAVRKPAAYDSLIEIAKNAGLEDSLRYSIFSAFLSTPDIGALDYFTRRAQEERLTRFKSLKEAMTHSDIEYSVKFGSDEYIKILAAVAANDFDKYALSTNGAHKLLTMGALIKYRSAEFPKIARRLMTVGDETVRRSALYAISSNRFEHTEFFPLVFECQPTLAEFAAFSRCFAYESIMDHYLPKLGKDFARKFFDMCIGVFDGLKKNTTFPATDMFPVSTSVDRASVAQHAIDIAAFLADGKLVQALDARYPDIPTEARARFWKRLDKLSSLDKRACVIEFLKTDNYEALAVYDALGITLTFAEAVRVSDWLKTKKQSVKNRILKEFLRSLYKDKIAAYLVGCQEDYKREIGTDMQKSSGKIDDKKLDEKQSGIPLFSSGPSVITFEKPHATFAKFAKRALPQISGKRLEELYAAIEKFVDDNKDYEYMSPMSSTKLTLGSAFVPTAYGGKFDCYPLWEKLKAIFDGFDAFEIIDLYIISCTSMRPEKFARYHENGNAQKTFDGLSKKYATLTAQYIRHIVTLYLDDYVDPERAAEYLYQMYLFGLLKPAGADVSTAESWRRSLPSALDDCPALVYRAMKANGDEHLKMLLELADGGLIDLDTSFGAGLIAKAYERKLISPDWLEYMLVKSPLAGSCLTARRAKNDLYIYSATFPYPEFREFCKTVITRTVDAELERGTLKTPYTAFVLRLGEIYGAELFAKAIVKLRGMTLVRNNSDYWFGDQKDDVLSKILKTVRPSADESYDDFKRIVDKYEVTRDELIRAAVYNLNFLGLVDKHLGISGFKSAVLYFAAHLNESLSEARIEQIKEYSTIDYHDFKDGAFDFEWYEEMIRAIPPKEFKRVYDNAKYITVAGLHKRAQRFFDARGGKISVDEAKENILRSRNKDYCLVYSLIPIKDDADLFARYEFFGDFLKESKKFGAQRQLSERRTVDIAFDNLARNAGYADSSVFIYEMESRDRRVIDMYDGMTVDGYTLRLGLSGEKVKLLVTDKNGKKLASVPSAIAKTPQAVEIAEYKKSEENKRKRLKRSLEEAMENAIDFTRAQILSITEQPLIRSFFERLILTDGTAAYILVDKEFVDIATGKPCEPNTLKIAHPVTLRENGTLRAAMKYAISHDIKQPFKQLFREMYIMSDVERDGTEVLRYKGFEVDLKKAVAALKNRGWGVSEDIGLRKVYYRKNTVSAIFREFDYYYIYDFGNENRELESIMFIDRRDYNIMSVKDVDPIVFSETLRDVDLMIAISANCVYDYDLAMSTFEMRRAMIGSIIDILDIKNVTFLKENVKIEGKYGTYVVNIRTGLTFKEGKGNLLIKTIDNYDKPLALDFIDEDPMTADIVTKVMLLSADADIKDPAILAEICG